MRVTNFLPDVLTNLPTSYVIIGSTIFFIFMGTMGLIVRQKAAKRPINAKKILLPPLFMSTGMAMFFFEEFQVPWLQVFEAIGVGMIFSTILIKTTNFERRDGDIFVKPSKAFIFILVGLLIFRVILKSFLSTSIDVGELGGMFFLLAYGMMVPWRIGMYLKHKQLVAEETDPT